MNLLSRRVAMFRCHTNPMLTAKPMQAYVPSQMGMEAEMDQHGVYIKVLGNGQRGESEHFVPFSNIESVRLEPEPDNAEVLELKRKNK